MSGPTAEAVNNDDLFGEPAGSAVATETPEEITGTEEPSGEEVETAAEPDEAEVEETEGSEETATEPAVENADVLRLIAKKGISLDKFTEYLTRYKLTAEKVNADPLIAQLVLDKAAADDLIAKQPKAEEPKKDEPKPDTPDLGKHLESLKARINDYTAPEIRSNFVKQLNEAKTTEEQFAVLEIAAANLVETIMEKRFGDVYSGFASRQQREHQERIDAHNVAWEPYKELNPNFTDAVKAYDEAAKLEPELVNNPNLTPQQRMKTVALVLGGRKAEAATVAEAAEKGKQLGLEAKKKAALGKGLGAGKSNGAIEKKPKGNDDIFGAPGEYPINQRLIGKS